jgi:hypothetical protein
VALSQGVALNVFRLGEVKPSTVPSIFYLTVLVTLLYLLYSPCSGPQSGCRTGILPFRRDVVANLAAALRQGVALEVFRLSEVKSYTAHSILYLTVSMTSLYSNLAAALSQGVALQDVFFDS